MSEDAEYLLNYKSNQLYTHPGKSGAYATIVGESEEVIAEIDITTRCKLAVAMFYVQEKRDFGTLKLTKFNFHKTYGWHQDGHIQLNNFQTTQLKEFLAVLSSLNLSDVQKTRLSLENVHIGALGALLGSSKGAELISELAKSPELHHDIYAVAAKRKALTEFELQIETRAWAEKDWQNFFETNPWIFGHGLNYISLDKVTSKLESVTTGSTFDQPGKRADALVRTRAEVSQYVLVEIKKPTADLLRGGTPYRAGCWGVSEELSSAVTQIQKTSFDFAQKRFRSNLKDEAGKDTGQIVYSVEPRSYLVIGNTMELYGNEDKIACFELYRRNIRSPEIITFDELLHRTRFIVDNLSHQPAAS